MSDEATKQQRRSFKKFSFRGVDLEDLLKTPLEDFTPLLHARGRRRFSRGLKSKNQRFLNKLKVAKLATEPNSKPPIVKTHLRNMIVIPEMIGSVVGVYNGKEFNTVEIKPEMTGHYLGEFSITYRPVAHKRPGASSTTSNRFIPLK